MQTTPREREARALQGRRQRAPPVRLPGGLRLLRAPQVSSAGWQVPPEDPRDRRPPPERVSPRATSPRRSTPTPSSRSQATAASTWRRPPPSSSQTIQPWCSSTLARRMFGLDVEAADELGEDRHAGPQVSGKVSLPPGPSIIGAVVLPSADRPACGGLGSGCPSGSPRGRGSRSRSRPPAPPSTTSARRPSTPAELVGRRPRCGPGRRSGGPAAGANPSARSAASACGDRGQRPEGDRGAVGDARGQAGRRRLVPGAQAEPPRHSRGRRPCRSRPSTSGNRARARAAAAWPGRWSPRSSRFTPRTTVAASAAASGPSAVHERRLAAGAAVGAVGHVGRVLHLVRSAPPASAGPTRRRAPGSRRLLRRQRRRDGGGAQHAGRGPSTSVATLARNAESAPPLKATTTRPSRARASSSQPCERRRPAATVAQPRQPTPSRTLVERRRPCRCRRAELGVVGRGLVEAHLVDALLQVVGVDAEERDAPLPVVEPGRAR